MGVEMSGKYILILILEVKQLAPSKDCDLTEIDHVQNVTVKLKPSLGNP